MFNAQRPNANDLPTTRQLLRATAAAVALAGAILLTVILPAEYAVDPTGIGRALGYTQMGELKTQLAAEAEPDLAVPVATGAAPVPPPTPEAAAPAARSDTTRVTLAPGEGAEVKVTAAKDTEIIFEWSVEGGHVNYDTHGDPANAPRGLYHGYGKGKASAGDRGTLVAAFDGKHGWFWRNRSGGSVTVILRTQGNYSEIRRVV